MNFWMRYWAVRIVWLLKLVPQLFRLFDRRRYRQRQWSALERFAREHELEHRPSRHEDAFGSLYGSIQGRGIWIQPDEDGRVCVLFRTEKDIWLDMRPHLRAERRDFCSPNRLFNSVFKARRASPELLARLNTHPELFDALMEAYTRWMAKLSRFRVARYGLDCELTPNPYVPSIDVQDLERFLPEMIRLVDRLENVLGGGGPEVMVEHI